MNLKKIDQTLISINIIFFIYYAVQLLVFTDEFIEKNVGKFNHAIAGLSEILGIIFFSIAIGLIIILFRGLKHQLPLFITIGLIQGIISLNFWRYILTDSPGETDIQTILINALIFTICSFITFVLFTRNKFTL